MDVELYLNKIKKLKEANMPIDAIVTELSKEEELNSSILIITRLLQMSGFALSESKQSVYRVIGGAEIPNSIIDIIENNSFQKQNEPVLQSGNTKITRYFIVLSLILVTLNATFIGLNYYKLLVKVLPFDDAVLSPLQFYLPICLILTISILSLLKKVAFKQTVYVVILNTISLMLGYIFLKLFFFR